MKNTSVRIEKSRRRRSLPQRLRRIPENISSPSRRQPGEDEEAEKEDIKYNNYDPDEPLDVLREMNQMLEEAETKPDVGMTRIIPKSTHLCSRSVRNVRRLGVSIGTDLMEKENRMKRDAAEELRRQLDKDSPEFSMDMLAAGDRATILAREAEILRAEEESLRRVREGTRNAAERERQRLESERVAYVNGRANRVSAENKRRGMGANARGVGAIHDAGRQVPRGSGVGTVTPTRVVPKFTTNGGDMEEDKENAGAMGSKRDKTTRPSSFFNPFKTITNVAVARRTPC